MRKRATIAVGIVMAGWAALVSAADGTSIAPSEAVAALDALLLPDGVHVQWDAACDLSVIAYRLDRRSGVEGGFEAVSGEIFAPMPWPDAGTRFDVPDRTAHSGHEVCYRVMAIRRDGTEVEVGRFSTIPHVPGGGDALSVAAVSSGTAVTVPVAAVSVPGDRVKISIRSTGLYGVDAASLAACLEGVTAEDVNAAIATGGIRMWTGTNDVAWMPSPGSTGVWFFAEARESIYTSNTFYWLELGAGTTMATRVAVAPAGPPAGGTTFTESLHFESDTSGYYNQTLFREPESDVWFWAYLGPTTNPAPTTQVVFSVTLPGVAPSSPAQIRWSMTGLTETWMSPEHHARCRVNGSFVGSVDWDGYATATPSFAVSNLVAGTNAVTIEAYTWPDEPYVLPYYIDSFDVTYLRQYLASSNSLLCTGGTNGDLWVSGFDTTNVWVFDVTSSRQCVRVVAPAVVWSNGEAAVGMASDGVSNRYLLAASPMAPVELQGRPRTSWGSPTNRADYVVITPAELRSGAEALAAYRQSEGFVTVVIGTEDLFDEFAGGVPTPWAIKDFIARAWECWDLSPRFVVLAGTGTINYRGVPGQASQPCYIPPLQVATPYGLYGSDTPLGDVDGDHVPEVAVGRLPVVTTNDLTALLQKMQTYEAAVTNCRTVTLNADNYSLSDGGFDFPAASDTLCPWIPGVYGTQRNYLTNLTSQMQAQFRGALQSGRTLMTYVGHASDTILANEPILSSADLPLMTNTIAPPFLAMACLFGRFDKPAIASEGLAQRCVRKAGGAFAAVWGCSSSSLNDDNIAVGRWMTRACFRKNGVRLGDAARQAISGYSREAGAKPYVMDTYTLLGDPALSMGIWNGEPRTFAEWQTQVFTPEQLSDPQVSGEHADPDEDGADNLSEFLSGTQPLAPESRLAITEARWLAGEGRQIWWTTISNRLYTVEKTADLGVPFRALVRGIWAQSPTHSLTDAAEQGVSPVFYRVRLEE